MAVDLTAQVGSLRLVNPIATASGTAGHGAELAAYFPLARLGAIVVKSLAALPWPGNPPPRLQPLPSGMLNSVGLQGPGVAAWLEAELPALERHGACVIASIWGRTVADYEAAARLLASAPSCVAAVEVNVSCPNLEDRGKMFSNSSTATAEAICAARGAQRPCWAKLSPNTADLIEVAGAALSAGAEALVLTNTLLGLAIDVEHRRPVLGGVGGGVSGTPLHAVALRAVFDCRAAFPDAAIVGVGGISTGIDAVEFLMAGANAVEVGTATLVDPRAPVRVLDELRSWCEGRGVTRVDELVGVAQRGAVPGPDPRKDAPQRSRLGRVGPGEAGSGQEIWPSGRADPHAGGDG